MENFSLANIQSKLLNKFRESKKPILIFVAILLFLFFFYLFFLSAPADFPKGTIIKIEKGSSLQKVSAQLKRDHIIKSKLAFEAFVIVFGKEDRVISTDYYFEDKLSVFAVARRLSKGEHRMPKIKVTIPEGFTSAQIADAFTSKLVNFNKAKFLEEVSGLEGKLFPDTYFFIITDTELEVRKSLQANFEKKIAPFRTDIASSSRTETEIITMASLIEGEARGDVDREFISGILWKRLSIGMPLQVDVAPETYKTRGLPKNPIGNPGMQSIKAAITPKSSSYLYYLHDKEGSIHYAKSFAEHRQNIVKYLK